MNPLLNPADALVTGIIYIEVRTVQVYAAATTLMLIVVVVLPALLVGVMV